MQNNLDVNLIPYELQLLPERYDEKEKKIKFEGCSSLAIQQVFKFLFVLMIVNYQPEL